MDELRDFNALNLAMIPFDEQDCIVDNQFFLAGDFGEAGPSRNYSSDPSMVPILTAPYPFKIQAAMMQLCLGGRMRVRLNLNEYELHRNSLLIVTPGSIGQCLDISADYRIVLIALSNSYIISEQNSEGALIALVAAQRSPAVAGVVSLCGTGYPLDKVLRLQLAGQLVPAHMELYFEAMQIIGALKRGERVDMAYHPQFQALFNTDVQPFIISQMRYDPQQELLKVKVPVLIAAGDNDLQVPAFHAEELAAVRRDAPLRVIPKMAHTLKACDETTLEGQMRTAYGDPTLPLAPGLVQAITEFLGGL